MMAARHPHGATEITTTGPQLWVPRTNPQGTYNDTESNVKSFKNQFFVLFFFVYLNSQYKTTKGLLLNNCEQALWKKDKHRQESTMI